jgi:hypothetical protein
LCFSDCCLDGVDQLLWAIYVSLPVRLLGGRVHRLGVLLDRFRAIIGLDIEDWGTHDFLGLKRWHLHIVQEVTLNLLEAGRCSQAA